MEAFESWFDTCGAGGVLCGVGRDCQCLCGAGSRFDFGGDAVGDYCGGWRSTVGCIGVASAAIDKEAEGQEAGERE